MKTTDTWLRKQLENIQRRLVDIKEEWPQDIGPEAGRHCRNLLDIMDIQLRLLRDKLHQDAKPQLTIRG